MKLVSRLLYPRSVQVVNYAFIILYTTLFVLARYPFYRYFPIPLPIVADGTEYYQVYKDIISGVPHFDIITPGYPFFISFIHEFFSEKAIALYIGQSVVAFIAGLLFIFYTHKYYNKCVPSACLALAIFLSQDSTLRFETASFPQSLMISSALAFLSFLMGVLNQPNTTNVMLMCISAVFMVLLKSSQLYILLILVLILIYFLLIRRKKIALWILSFLGIPLLIYAVYNYMTFGDFTIIASGILKADAKQKVIHENEQAFFYKVGSQLPSWHPIYKIHYSTDSDTLQWAYLTTRWGSTLIKDSLRHVINLVVTFEMKETVNVDSIVLNNSAFTQAERTWYLANKDSFEGVFINFYPRGWKRFNAYVLNYFLNIKRESPLFYYSELQWRYENFFITRAWAKRYDLTELTVKEKLSFLLREFYQPEQGSMDFYKAQYNKMASDFFFKIYDVYGIKIGQPITRNIFWVYAYLILSSITVLFFLMRPRSPHRFFLLTLVLIHLGSCLIHAIWGDPLDRYSHATEFIPFLLLAFSPLLFMKKK